MPAGGNVNGIIPYPTTVSVLDNGLKLIVMPMPSNGLLGYWSVVRTGSRDEFEPGRSGFAHFFEHMMFRGTESFPNEVYQRILTEIGADGNAYTTDDLTAYHLGVTGDDLERVMELESDRFQNLFYSEHDFKTEAGAVYGEYRKSKTEPLFVLYEAVRAAAFEQHPYGHTTLGYERDIAIMPTLYEFSQSFLRRYYRPENTVLLLTGDVEPARAEALAARYYGDWQPGYEEPAIPDEPEQTGERRIEVSYDGQTLPLIWTAYKLGRFDPDDRLRVAADLLVELAFGPTSAAYQRLVLNEQELEFLTAYTNANRDPTLLDIYARVKNPDRVAYVQSVIDETAAGFAETRVDAGRVEALKRRLRYGFLMQLETADATAGALARPLALSGGLDGIEAQYAAYERVTADDIRDAAREIFRTARRTVAVLTARA
jgi:zinc protease